MIKRRTIAEVPNALMELFVDSDWYSIKYPDTEGFPGGPASHFLAYGRFENRSPNSKFDGNSYLQANPDVAAAGVNPWIHFENSGFSEKRNLSPSYSFRAWIVDAIYNDLRLPLSFPWVNFIDPEFTRNEMEIFDRLQSFLDFDRLYLDFPSLRNVGVNLFAIFENLRFETINLYEYLKFPELTKTEAPLVSIIILNWNKSSMTLVSLFDVLSTIGDSQVEVTVVDNGSDPQEFLKLNSVRGNHKLIRLPVNQYFGEGNNVGAESSNGKILIFLNNDVFVTRNWLLPLIEPLLTDSSVGMVGPLFTYPSGAIQEAGVRFNVDATVEMIGRGSEIPQDWFLDTQEVDYTSATCVAMRKNDFEELGGFDYIFEPAYYEDADLALRMHNLLGKKSIFQPKSTVIHFEHETSSDSRSGLDLSNAVSINRNRFLERWDLEERSSNGSYKARSSALIGERNLPLNTHAKVGGKPKVHLFTPFEISLGGGERYLFSIAAALTENYDVSIVSGRKYTLGRLTQIARDLSLDLRLVDLITLNKSRQQHPEIFIHMDNHYEPATAGYGLYNIFLCQFPFPMNSELQANRFGNLNTYSKVIVYSQFTKNNFLNQIKQGTNTSIDVIAPPVPNHGVVPIEKNESRILSVGRFFLNEHNKNFDKLLDSFSSLENFRELELNLVGGISTSGGGAELIEKLRKVGNENVKIHPNAAPDKLHSLLNTSSIYWHGTGLGIDSNRYPEKCEHFGIAPLEAMTTGCIPFVVNSGGPTEYVKHGINGFLYESKSDLALLTKRFLSLDSDSKDTMRQNARDTASSFSEIKFAQEWNSLLQALLKN